MGIDRENSTSRTLILEDDAASALELKTTLEMLGYQVTGLEMTAEKGLALCEKDPPDLVFMKSNLKGRLDGFETGEILRSRWGIPLVFIMADRDTERLKKAGPTYPFGYVVKPFRVQDLKVALEIATCVSGVGAKGKRADESLRSSEEKFAKIFKTSPDPISIIRLSDGIFLDVNDSFLKVTGYPREEIVGRPYFSSDIWIRRRDRIRVVEALKKNGEIHEMGTLFRGRDGKTIYGLISARALEINGESCVVGIVNDITERKRMEEELSRSEEKFRTIFENSPVATALIEPDSTFSMVNDAYCQICGYTRQEILGMSWTQIIHPEDLEKMKEYYQHRLINPQNAPARYEFSFQRKNGEVRHGLISPAIIPSSRQLISSVVDITERKEAEKALQESKERLRALSARLQSVREEERANISREIHDDLGQLLTGLKMDLSWLLRHPQPDPAEVQAKGKAMGQLIDQTVQTVRRISTELRPRILDDFGLIAALEWQAEEFTKKTGIACRYRSTVRQLDLKPDLSIAIFRIFQEALTNVARHSGATRVEASLQEEAKDLVLTVRDNGQGIPDEAIARSPSLGLVGMRERALIFGGTIEIQGKKGKGTTVILRVPVHQEAM